MSELEREIDAENRRLFPGDYMDEEDDFFDPYDGYYDDTDEEYYSSAYGDE
jgi:hypothetical protein